MLGSSGGSCVVPGGDSGTGTCGTHMWHCCCHQPSRNPSWTGEFRVRNLSRDVSASNLSLPRVVWEQLEGRNPGSAQFQRLGEGLAQENLGRNFTPAQLL